VSNSDRLATRVSVRASSPYWPCPAHSSPLELKFWLPVSLVHHGCQRSPSGGSVQRRPNTWSRASFSTKNTPPLPSQPPHDGGNAHTLGRIGKHNVVFAGLAKGKYGLTSAATVAKDKVHYSTLGRVSCSKVVMNRTSHLMEPISI
jgi:hypothetical protein